MGAQKGTSDFGKLPYIVLVTTFRLGDDDDDDDDDDYIHARYRACTLKGS